MAGYIFVVLLLVERLVATTTVIEASSVFLPDYMLTSITPTTTSSVPVATPLAPANVSLLSSTTNECSCDVTVRSCDLDCCCDNDCTVREVEVFSQCLDTEQDSSSTTGVCLNNRLIFRSSLSNSVLSGLFCVYTDNYPGRREFPSIDTVTSLSEAEDRLSEFGSTASSLEAIPSFEPYESNYYRSGDPIEVLYGTEASGYLPLPSSLNGEYCHDGNPVTYLTDQSTSCNRYLSPDGAECSASSFLNAALFHINFTVLAFPLSDQNEIVVLVPVELRSVTCHDLIGQTVSCDSIAPPVFDSTSLTCSNTLLSLSYTIVHNATQGITSVTADITVGTVSIGVISQSFAVQFVYSDTNITEATLVRPGNPGYIQGQPVLAGVLTGDTVNVSSNSESWLTVVGSSSYCQGLRDSVTFRNDYRSSCVLMVSLDRVLSGCEDLDTLSILLGTQPRVDRIAIYGNADVNDLSQWVELLGLEDESIPLQVGCVNVITGVQLVVFYSYTGETTSPQPVITGSQIKYLTQDIKSQCSLDQCSLASPSVPVILESLVTFVPVYIPPAEVLLSTNVILRRLPHDFLYPLFAGSGVAVVTPSVALLTVVWGVLWLYNGH